MEPVVRTSIPYACVTFGRRRLLLKAPMGICNGSNLVGVIMISLDRRSEYSVCRCGVRSTEYSTILSTGIWLRTKLFWRCLEGG